MSELLAFFDVDTQIDFMLPQGKLYVPGAEAIIPNLSRLMACAREHAIPVISSADAHAPDDVEFSTWPPHCVIGTPGQQRIQETRWPQPLIVPSLPGAFFAPRDWPRQVVIEKAAYDASANPNLNAILRALGPRRAVVFGVATEFCVRASALALRARGFPVDLVVDAIQAITAEGGRKAKEEMVAAGVRLVTTDEVLGFFTGKAETPGRVS